MGSLTCTGKTCKSSADSPLLFPAASAIYCTRRAAAREKGSAKYKKGRRRRGPLPPPSFALHTLYRALRNWPWALVRQSEAAQGRKR